MSASYNPQPLPPLNPNLDATKNHYWNYHDLEALLNCKNPLTASQDEDLFIASVPGGHPSGIIWLNTIRSKHRYFPV
jgi:hypothetical protein